MSEQNGDPKDGPPETEGNGYRDSKGRFLPGAPPGPGRPARPDFLKVARLRAERYGQTLEQALVDLLDKAWSVAESTDKDRMAAMRLVMENIWPAAVRAMELNVDARQIHLHPQAPEGRSLDEWLARFPAVLKERGLLADDDD